LILDALRETFGLQPRISKGLRPGVFLGVEGLGIECFKKASAFAHWRICVENFGFRVPSNARLLARAGIEEERSFRSLRHKLVQA